MEIVKYSLVIPVYKNEETIPDLLSECNKLNKELKGELEVVFVVDGSPDQSFMTLAKMLPEQSFVSQLLLHSRNYGSFPAIRTGIEAANGQFFAVMAADLQEPPEMIVEFFNALENDDVDVVVGTRESREDPLLSRLMSSLFWKLYRKLVIPSMPAGGVDMFGCNLQFKDALMDLKESNSSLVGLIFWLGFKRKEIPYHRRIRVHGKSAWTFSKKFNYLMDSVFSFSDLPIKILMFFGLSGMAIAVFLALVIIFLRVNLGIETAGYAATMVTILFFGALNSVGLGIIGSYVWRAYGNTQQRPLAVTMRALEFTGKAKEK